MAAGCSVVRRRSSVWAVGFRRLLELLRGLDERVDGVALDRRGLTQGPGALPGDGALLRGAELVARLQQRLDELALLARERVRRP